MSVLEALQEAIDRSVDDLGRAGTPRLARAIGVSRQRLDNLYRRRLLNPDEPLPGVLCPAIERHTGVRCERLCPPADWAYLRGSKARVQADKK